MEEQSLEEQIRDLMRGRGVPSIPETPRAPVADGSCRLVVHYYGGRTVSRYDTVQEAVRRAIDTLDAGEAWPVKIEQGARVLWEMDEFQDSRGALTQLLPADE